VPPDNIDAAVAAHAVQTSCDNRERRNQGEADARALVKVDGAIAGIMAAIEDGLYQPSMKARMTEPERGGQKSPRGLPTRRRSFLVSIRASPKSASASSRG
jgi:hypothetical protein